MSDIINVNRYLIGPRDGNRRIRKYAVNRYILSVRTVKRIG